VLAACRAGGCVQVRDTELVEHRAEPVCVDGGDVGTMWAAVEVECE
jgi:hypothetical protein